MRSLILTVALLLSLIPSVWANCKVVQWPLWQSFAERHLQADGHIIDFQSPLRHSTSEGQAYGMFFALVTNDRPAFDRILGWTERVLADGNLSTTLPAWEWNAASGVLDPNSASDADLWIAYDLIEAGRLWHDFKLTHRGLAMLANISAREVLMVDNLGPVLLSGPTGFVDGKGRLRLNPSYSPLPLLRRFADVDAAGPWSGLAQSSTRMIAESTPRGMAADWVGWLPNVGFVADGTSQAIGSYDAIRVYLWLGMSGATDPLALQQAAHLRGPQTWLSNHVQLPEKIDTVNGNASGNAPVGFDAAILPYLKTRGDPTNYNAMRTRVNRQLAVFARSKSPEFNYYDSVLSLFGYGWSEGLFRFSAAGELQTNWEKACPFAAKRSH
ncbi:cellulose synthase complex periplasmic endoglucanase BcsZ [Glaciimonas sp. PAMC28666]|uniref:cellulose synthase complex periplasmic endoglucanase BcsZ n=1 Tax=Glaciimonas sp. PAMC28666 TaxID=2807626 RepID=UPI0019625E80|nr:cellulose synthase complex periplasmic endoglucanase BcsZ [Glaciimonas sp. PAMC28666]QRX82493.1 cellulase [Glaciimonas sp. PAMC28666]